MVIMLKSSYFIYIYYSLKRNHKGLSKKRSKIAKIPRGDNVRINKYVLHLLLSSILTIFLLSLEPFLYLYSHHQEKQLRHHTFTISVRRSNAAERFIQNVGECWRINPNGMLLMVVVCMIQKMGIQSSRKTHLFIMIIMTQLVGNVKMGMCEVKVLYMDVFRCNVEPSAP